MKLWLLLGLCAVAVANPLQEQDELARFSNLFNNENQAFGTERNFLVNALVRQLITYLRHVIKNGSVLMGLPPLDPLELDHYNLSLPVQLINLDLDLKNVLVTGFGDFKVARSHLDLSSLSFDLELSIPRIDISAEEYDLIGNFYSAIPLYGKGKAKFAVDDFTIAAKLYLKQSEDKNSILIDRIESPLFAIPALKSNLSGVIGGGDIDAIVNTIIEDVLINYVNRFQGAIASLTSSAIVHLGNPILDQLDTWRFIAPLVPRPREY